MRLRAAFALMVLTVAGLSVAPARAADGNCDVSGPAGQYQVRKITIPQGAERGLYLSMTLSRPRTTVTDGDNWHMFGGIWIINAYNGGTNSWGFIDASYWLNPSGVSVTFQDKPLASTPATGTDLILDGVQGRYKINPTLIPGTYYIVGFGNGYGTWHAAVDIAGSTSADCPLIDVAGKVVGFDASDFTGGTQARVPGYGTATGAKLSFTSPHRYMIGGLYAYEPAPFPKVSLAWRTEYNQGVFENPIVTWATSVHSVDWTVNYTGKTNTILIQLLSIELLFDYST